MSTISRDELVEKINAGKAFLNKASLVMDKDQILDGIIEVPADVDLHFIFNLHGSKETLFEMYENPAYTGGTPRPFTNHDFSKPNSINDPAFLTVFRDGATVTNSGTWKADGRVDGSLTSIAGKVIMAGGNNYMTRTTSFKNNNIVDLDVSAWEVKK